MKDLNFKIQSESPLLLHNGQTANPMNSFSKQMKQVSSKRGKTDADFEQMAKIEWYAGLYLKDGKVCITAEVWEAAIATAAKKMKLGKQVQAGVFCKAPSVLEFDGDTLTIDELWERQQNLFTVGVRVSMSKVMRTRPIFHDWGCKVALQFDDTLVNEANLVDIMKIAGAQIGVCDWRPKFGRFTAEKVK